MKVLELIDEAEVGGGQNHVLLLAKGLKQRGVDVSVACESSGYLVEKLRESDIPVLGVCLENKVAPSSFVRLVRLFREHRFAIVHTHGGTAGFWGRLAAAFTGVPIRIHTYHGIHTAHRQNSFERWLLLKVERALLRVTSHIICVSQGDFDLGRELKLLKEGKATVIKNGIDVERFQNTLGGQKVRAEFRWNEHHRIIGTVGRLHHQKGISYLIEAIPHIVKEQQRARFLIVGDGPLRCQFESRVSDLGISDFVIFTGARQDIPDLMSAVDLFVLPSLWEGFPLVLLEASAAGKPIVATAVEGTTEIIKEGVTGLLVSPKDVKQLADALLELIKNTELCESLSRNAKNSLKSEYSSEQMVGSISDLYDRLYQRIFHNGA